MNISKHQIFVATGVSLMIVALCKPAIADQPAQPSGPPDKQAGTALEEIVVTAEHREASLQDVPIAISAVTGSELQREHITDIGTLATTLPDVQFNQQLGMARVFIRGVGLDTQSPGADPRVAIYADEVYDARPQAGFASFFDVDRIEVLNGPQGTLYGRNATAGAVNIITRNPTDTLSGYGTVTYGNYDLVQTEGAISGPLTSDLSGRLAFTTADHGGYGTDISTGGPVDDENRRAIRTKLLYKPTDTASVLLAVDYSKENDHIASGEHFISNTPGSEVFGQEQGYTMPSSPYDTAGSEPRSVIETYGASAAVNVDLDKFRLTSITGYRHTESTTIGNANLSSENGLPLTFDEKSDQYSEELRLAHSFDPVDMLVGVYFFHEANTALSLVNISSAYFPAFAETDNCCTGIPPQSGPFTLLQGAYSGGTQNTNAYALFTQETVHFTDKFGLDLGARYSYEKRHIDQFYQFDLSQPATTAPVLSAAAAPVPATYATQQASWDAFNPKVTLHYNFTPDVMAYATYTTGFKSGGFNFAQIQPAFAPEKLTDYEVGVKADIFDHRLRMNLAAFHYDYTNLQVNTVVETSLITTNAGRAKLDGFEAQISAAPIDNLHFDLNGAWLDARYTNFMTTDPGRPELGILNLAGNQLQYAPRGKVSGAIAYTINTQWGDLTPRTDLTWTSHVFFSQFNLPYIAQNSYYLSNIYLDWNAGNGWTTTAFLKNVSNRYYLVGEVQSAIFIGGAAVGQPGDPRTFGISITKRWQ